MALFPKDQGFDESSGSAPKRMRWIREQGTQKLLMLVGVISLAWLCGAQIYDRWLLQAHWQPLAASPSGLTVVGTLNARESYDRNLFKIINANKSSRVVISEYGWKSLFDERNGPLFSDPVANAIRAALDVDDVVGDMMLTPYLRATVRKQMGDPGAFKEVREELPIVIPKHTKNGSEERTTLGDLIKRYAGKADPGESSDTPGEGSASGREQEHLITVSSPVLLASCPILLTDGQVDGASMEEVRGSILTPVTYTVHLNLSAEGRSRFFQWSHDHVNENVVFVLNGEVVAAPRITQPLNVSDFAISNVQDLKGAKSLVAYFAAHGKS